MSDESFGGVATGTFNAEREEDQSQNEEYHEESESHHDDSVSDDLERVPCVCSKRWQFAYLAFFGLFWLSVHRVNLSMAIVCMVKQEYLSKATLKAVNDNTTSYSNMTKRNDSFLYLTVVNTSASWNPFGNISRVNESVYIKQIETDQENHQDGCHAAFETIVEEYRGAEFEWPKTVQSGLLSCYYYGSIATQFAVGYLATRFGGKKIASVALLISCLSIVLVPTCARANVYIVYVLRVITGLAGGAVIPSVYSMIGDWTLPQERSRLTSVITLGTMMGMVATLSSSGLLCAYGFDNGWGSIFYIHGFSPLPFILCWHCFVYNTPEKHPGITPQEKRYLQQSRKPAQRVDQTPWKKIFTSKTFYAVLVSQFFYNWTFFSIITLLPTYMKEVLKFDVKQNGGFSSLPFITMALSVYTAGHLADFMVTKKCVDITAVRRILQTICSLDNELDDDVKYDVGPKAFVVSKWWKSRRNLPRAFLGSGVCLVIIGFVTCDTRHYAVVLLCLCTVFEGLFAGGLAVIYMDFSGVYAGTVFGICNSIANTVGMIAPIVAGVMSKTLFRTIVYYQWQWQTMSWINQAAEARDMSDLKGTQEEWRNFFYLTAGLNILGAVVFAIFARATPARWAVVETTREVEDEGAAMT